MEILIVAAAQVGRFTLLLMIAPSLLLSLSLFPVDQRARRCSASTIMLIFERKEERMKERKKEKKS
jgi:hypothetical protein